MVFAPTIAIRALSYCTDVEVNISSYLLKPLKSIRNEDGCQSNIIFNYLNLSKQLKSNCWEE